MKPPSLDSIKNEGFPFTAEFAPAGVTTLAIMSLDIGLQSFFSTYKSVASDYRRIKLATGHQADACYRFMSVQYCRLYSQTIIHFQHFVELFIKDILRKEHTLLTSDYSRNHAIFYDLIKGNPTDSKDVEKGYEVEFSISLDRICELIKEKKLSGWQDYAFIGKSQQVLSTLASFRNRLIHRGAFVLRYRALDEFIGGYILPFLILAANSPLFKEMKRLWTYAPAACGIDPVTEIANSFSNQSAYNMDKIALYKEIGRACYAIPGRVEVPSRVDVHNQDSKNGREFDEYFGVTNYETQESDYDWLAARIELFQKLDRNILQSKTCIACGKPSLLIRGDEHIEETEEGLQSYGKVVYEVECLNCTLSPGYDLGNLNSLDSRVPDFFKYNQD